MFLLGQKLKRVITVKLFPEEVQALEVVSKLAGWEGNKSTALREFMKIWIEAAVVTIDSDSAIKGTFKMMGSMQRLTKQMQAIQKNTIRSKEEELLHEANMQILREAIA